MGPKTGVESDLAEERIQVRPTANVPRHVKLCSPTTPLKFDRHLHQQDETSSTATSPAPLCSQLLIGCVLLCVCR